MAIAPLFLADHPALDLLNTVVQIDGTLVDLIDSDDAVVAWLRDAGMLGKTEAVAAPATRGLLDATRELRELLRDLVGRRKAGKKLEHLGALNAFLSAGQQTSQLAQDRAGELRLETRFGRTTARELLFPLALSAAELLVSGDFALVRSCESDDCVLSFYDRTRSHRRRWCSMATCGNRHKVASFRERQRRA